MPCSDACGSTLLQLLVYGLTNGAVVALNAVGFTLAYAVAGQINLAHGNVFALAAVLVASLARALGVTAADPPLVRVAAVVLLAACGAGFGAALNSVVERLAFRPFRGPRVSAPDPLAPLIATVGLSFVLLQVAIWWHLAYNVPGPGHQGVNLPLLAMPDLLPAVELGREGVSFTLKDAFVLVLAAATAAGLATLLARSASGRSLRAVAQDAEMAALCGADPRRARAFAFALAGALAGLGAAIFAAYYGGTSAQHGLRSGLTAMTAAVLGGVGNPGGALVGGVVLGVFASFSDYLLDAHWTPVLVLLLLVGLLTLRPMGLLSGGGGDGAGSATESVPPPVPATVASRSPAHGRLLLAGLLALALAYPLVEQLAGWQRLYGATTALLLVTLAVGLSVVVGFAGLLDLGYVAFFAIGGYTAALLTGSGSRLALALPPGLREPWLALPLAGLIAGAFGLVFGLPGIRARGEYLAIVTLAFGEIVPGVILHLPYWTGGPRGMTGVPAAATGPWPPGSPMHPYILALALATFGYLAAARLGSSRAGRAWAAVRDDEVAARSVGISAPRARLLAFAIGAGYAGLAGAIYAGLHGHIAPEQFDLTLSLMVLAAVVIGGRWGLPGVVLGALLVAAYDRLLLEALTGGLRALGAGLGLPSLATIDLRGDNFAMFGIALYLATLLRARGNDDWRLRPLIGRRLRSPRPSSSRPLL